MRFVPPWDFQFPPPPSTLSFWSPPLVAASFSSPRSRWVVCFKHLWAEMLPASMLFSWGTGSSGFLLPLRLLGLPLEGSVRLNVICSKCSSTFGVAVALTGDLSSGVFLPLRSKLGSQLPPRGLMADPLRRWFVILVLALVLRSLVPMLSRFVLSLGFMCLIVSPFRILLCLAVQAFIFVHGAVVPARPAPSLAPDACSLAMAEMHAAGLSVALHAAPRSTPRPHAREKHSRGDKL